MSKDHNVPFIYESLDGGQTIFLRRFGDHSTKEQVPMEEDEKCARIQKHCRKLDVEMLEWEQDGYYDQFKQENTLPKKDPDPEARCFYQLHP